MRTKEARTKKIKPLHTVTYLNDKRPSRLSENKNCTCLVPAEFHIYEENADMYVSGGKE